MIKKVNIKNFRTIQELDLNFHDLGIIVGPNNVGKTTILKVLDAVLGETYPANKFDIEDFHDSSVDSITVEIDLEKPIYGRNLRSKDLYRRTDIPIKKFMFVISKSEQELHYEFTAYGNNDKIFYGDENLRKQINFVYIPANRDLPRHLFVNKKSVWGKILHKFDEEYKKNQNAVEFKKSMELPKEILENNDVYKKFKNMFLTNCEKNIKGSEKLILDFQMYDPLFYYKMIGMFGKSDTLAHIHVEKFGYGIQNLILISLFQTYAEIFKNKIILAIEEPEAFLDTFVQRVLFSNFKNITAAKQMQIIYSTHSVNFVQPNLGHKIIILKKNIDGDLNAINHNVNLESELEDHHIEIYSKFNPERNELFFAKKILLVEGKSDKLLFETLCDEKWGIDINEHGISIIECGSKSGVIYFIGVCKSLGIENYYAVWDEGKNGSNHELFAQSLKNGKGFQMKKNLETHLDIIKYGESKLENAFRWVKNDYDENKLRSIKEIYDFLKP